MDHASFPSDHEKAISYKRIDVSSAAFKENGFISPRYTCDGKDVNPALNFDHIPAEAQVLPLLLMTPMH